MMRYVAQYRRLLMLSVPVAGLNDRLRCVARAFPAIDWATAPA
jgi:hypothetical protein